MPAENGQGPLLEPPVGPDSLALSRAVADERCGSVPVDDAAVQPVEPIDIPIIPVAAGASFSASSPSAQIRAPVQLLHCRRPGTVGDADALGDSGRALSRDPRNEKSRAGAAHRAGLGSRHRQGQAAGDANVR